MCIALFCQKNGYTNLCVVFFSQKWKRHDSYFSQNEEKII